MNSDHIGKTIRYRLDGHVLTVTLNRPERLNALNQVMVRELSDAFDRSDGDDAVRAVIVTGAGRAFCSGFDLERGDVFDHGVAFGPGQTVPRDLGGELTLRIFDSLKPVIAAINGPAVGIGATMLLPMDIRLASPEARIGFVFGRRGIVPEAASSWFLPRVVGISRALDWTLTGRLVPAQEALSAGLYSFVHEESALLAAARAVAEEIAEQVAPVSASLTRQMMWKGLSLAHPMEAHRIDSRLMAARGAHEDSREGVASFLEKRRPRFVGRVSRDAPNPSDIWPPLPFE